MGDAKAVVDGRTEVVNETEEVFNNISQVIKQIDEETLQILTAITATNEDKTEGAFH